MCMTDISEFQDIQITALPHPDDEVRRFGFDLTDPYVEQCWGATVGPSSVVLLRRLPTLWTEHEPTVLPTDQLARSLGIGHRLGRNGSFRRTLERVARFRLGEWLEPAAMFAVYTTAPPVSDAQLQRLPEWTR